MESPKNNSVRLILLSNGIVDLFAASALFFPLFNIPLTGYASYTSQLIFIAGGWGIAALTFGIGSIYGILYLVAILTRGNIICLL